MALYGHGCVRGASSRGWEQPRTGVMGEDVQYYFRWKKAVVRDVVDLVFNGEVADVSGGRQNGVVGGETEVIGDFGMRHGTKWVVLSEWDSWSAWRQVKYCLLCWPGPQETGSLTGSFRIKVWSCQFRMLHTKLWLLAEEKVYVCDQSHLWGFKSVVINRTSDVWGVFWICCRSKPS